MAARCRQRGFVSAPTAPARPTRPPAGGRWPNLESTAHWTVWATSGNPPLPVFLFPVPVFFVRPPNVPVSLLLGPLLSFSLSCRADLASAASLFVQIIFLFLFFPCSPCPLRRAGRAFFWSLLLVIWYSLNDSLASISSVIRHLGVPYHPACVTPRRLDRPPDIQQHSRSPSKFDKPPTNHAQQRCLSLAACRLSLEYWTCLPCPLPPSLLKRTAGRPDFGTPSRWNRPRTHIRAQTKKSQDCVAGNRAHRWPAGEKGAG